MFFRSYLGWSLKHVAQNYIFIAISFYRNNAILCAKISSVGPIFKVQTSIVTNFEVLSSRILEDRMCGIFDALFTILLCLYDDLGCLDNAQY